VSDATATAHASTVCCAFQIRRGRADVALRVRQTP
jgi:hypothetical protein